jgi:ubiquitin-conjugating enzyme E2 J1
MHAALPVSKHVAITEEMNQRNTAVKRIHADVKEMNTHPSSRYHAIPLEDNIFEWHFTIRGPIGTDFEGGIYHGRIILSPEYPFKPPHIIFLTV